MIIYNFIPMSLFLVLFRKNESFERIPIQVAILSLITAFIIIGYGDISNLVIGDRFTLSESIGIESIALSRLAVFVFVVSFFSLINTRGLRTQLPFILSLMLSIYVMLLSAQRGPIVGLGVGMLFWVVFKSGLKTKLRSLVALVIVVMVTLTFNIDQFGVTDRFDDLRNYETYARYDDFPRTYALFLESPILGHGVKGYFEKTGRVYPHNIFLEVIAEYGVVGLAILMIMLGEIFKWIMSILYSTRSESYKMALAMAWIALFVSSQFSSDLSGNHIFYSVSGLVCSVMIAEKEKGKARKTKRWAELSILAQPQKG
ncbi:MAG: O-antigen ligase family protein [Gammaproteobacteria bacterium]